MTCPATSTTPRRLIPYHLSINLVEVQPTNISSTESQQALAEMADFLQAEVERVATELRAHHISPDRIRDLLPIIENSATVEVRETEFTLHRNFTNGFDIEWHDQQLAA